MKKLLILLATMGFLISFGCEKAKKGEDEETKKEETKEEETKKEETKKEEAPKE